MNCDYDYVVHFADYYYYYRYYCLNYYSAPHTNHEVADGKSAHGHTSYCSWSREPPPCRCIRSVCSGLRHLSPAVAGFEPSHQRAREPGIPERGTRSASGAAGTQPSLLKLLVRQAEAHGKEAPRP